MKNVNRVVTSKVDDASNSIVDVTYDNVRREHLVELRDFVRKTIEEEITSAKHEVCNETITWLTNHFFSRAFLKKANCFVHELIVLNDYDERELPVHEVNMMKGMFYDQ